VVVVIIMIIIYVFGDSPCLVVESQKLRLET